MAAESHFPGSRTYLPHLITVLLLIIALVTGLLYFLYIRRKVGASDDNEDLSAPASPSTPMRPEAGDTVTIEQERPEPDQERLYPALPSAPEPPYNPYFRPEAGDGGRELEIIGNTKCDNSGCVTCAKMVTGAVFRSSVTGREYGVSDDDYCDSDDNDNDDYYEGETEAGDRDKLRGAAPGVPGHLHCLQ